ncbi:hypothetical protein C8F04DRAFT_1181617 [Mycena alexandri]|uniref:Uncharacterized protein n=1 Tax=Mycena alexandri TaxID=1745969 RepID=A0AAD6X239_9AGAR|nr:hypothetical protein C8F04DRAFT_1181617 [Mycena alexandri]
MIPVQIWQQYEEMRRTIQYDEWMTEQWRARAGARTRNVAPEVEEGLRAYVMEHVKREEVTCTKLVAQWRGLRERAGAYLAGVRDDMRGLAQVVVDLDGDEEEPDDEGDVEGDENVDGEEEDDPEDNDDE